MPDRIWAGEHFVNGVQEVGDQRRKALFAYSLTFGKAANLPRRNDFDTTEVRRLLAKIELQDVVRDPIHLRYRLMGSDVIQLRESNHTGQQLHKIYQNFEQSITYKRLATVVEERRSIWCIGRPTHQSRSACRLRELLHLPFAADGESVDTLLTAVLVRR